MKNDEWLQRDLHARFELNDLDPSFWVDPEYQKRLISSHKHLLCSYEFSEPETRKLNLWYYYSRGEYVMYSDEQHYYVPQGKRRQLIPDNYAIIPFQAIDHILEVEKNRLSQFLNKKKVTKSAMMTKDIVKVYYKHTPFFGVPVFCSLSFERWTDPISSNLNQQLVVTCLKKQQLNETKQLTGLSRCVGVLRNKLKLSLETVVLTEDNWIYDQNAKSILG